jgi:hypothetical protein
MEKENRKSKKIENLSDLQESIIQNNLKKEKELAVYFGFIFLFFTLIGPYLPAKIPSFKETKMNYFPLVLFHFLFWGSMYLISLRKYFKIKKDYEKRVKINTTAKVLKKEMSKTTTSIKYFITIEIGNKEIMNFEISQVLFEKFDKNDNIFISYTPHSKIVLEIIKCDYTNK